MTVELPVKIRVDGIPEMKAALGQLQSSWNLQAQAIRGMVSALGATAVFAGTLSFLKSEHELAQQSRTSITLLTNQLGFYSAALNDQAEALSKSLFVQKSDVLAADQRLLIYTREESSIKKLIPGIIDLAKVKGIDLATAANNVGLSLKRADESAAGHLITIRGLGIVFKATGTEAGNVAALEDALKKAVGGSAQAVADSLDGWSKLSFWIGKAKEDIGKLIFGISRSELANKQYKDNVILLAEAQEKLAGLEKQSTPGREWMYKEAIEGAKKQVAALQVQVKGYEYLTETEKKEADVKQKNSDIALATEKLQEEAGKLTLQSKRANLIKEKEDAIKLGVDKTLVNEVYGAKIAAIDEEITKKKEEQLNKQLEDARKTAKAEEKAGEEHENEMFENAKEAFENTRKLKAAAIKQQFELDLAAAKQKPKPEKEIAIIQAKYKKEIALAKLNGESTVTIEAETAQEIADIKSKQEQDQERALDSTTKNLQTLASKHKEWTGLYKTAAIAQATVDTYKSAESVYAGFATIPIVGIPLGIAAAAAAIAAGLANVQQIASQKMAYGGVAIGGVPGQDSIPTMLMPGEVVYNPAHPNPALAAMITNDNSSTSNQNYHISMPITIHGNPTNTTIAKIGEVTQKALFNALRKAQNTGKLSASGLVVRP